MPPALVHGYHGVAQHLVHLMVDQQPAAAGLAMREDLPGDGGFLGQFHQDDLPDGFLFQHAREILDQPREGRGGVARRRGQGIE